MDLAENGINRKVFLEGRGVEIFGEYRKQRSAPSRGYVGKQDRNIAIALF
jgi:hypothetical protein